MNETTYHTPVLVNEVITFLNPKPNGLYLDVTFGGGGHTRAILEKEPTCRVIGLDWDEDALSNGQAMVDEFDGRLRLVWGNFGQLYKIAKSQAIGNLDGILADFGTSHYQIGQRAGFSIYRDTPLDMRMSPAHFAQTAADLINHASFDQLCAIFFQLGEEQHAKAIARFIIQERSKKAITSTQQLAQLIEKVVPAAGRKIHPATKVFQALRIYVNKELDNIQAFLPAAARLLNDKGRMVCISFHSLEDRLVKQFFTKYEQENPGMLKILTDGTVQATEQEITANPASRSARLRAAEFYKK